MLQQFDCPDFPSTADVLAGADPETAAWASQVLLADESGVRKLAAGASPRVVVDTIAYGADGGVDLTGRARNVEGGAGDGGFVRAYLDNAEAGMAALNGSDQWQMRLTGVAPGLYTLRVDQLDREGKVVSRFETPFLREDPGALAASGQAARAAGATEAEPAVAGGREGAGAPPGAAPPPAPPPETPAAAPAETPPETPTRTPRQPEAPLQAGIVAVQPGYTLWAIAKANYGSGLLYVKVFEANRSQIRDPDLIYPGQVFSVPKD